MQNLVTLTEINGMVTHWLGTPLNGYLGSDYGQEIQSLLQSPMQTALGDAFIDKLVSDVPLLGAMPDGAVNLYWKDHGGRIDAKDLFLQLGGATLSLADTINNLS